MEGGDPAVGTLLLGASATVALSMAWAIGAQDVSNALGTSVGSKALTVKQAILVGAVCEFAGSLVGGEVAATISGGILELDSFKIAGTEGMSLYAHCMFCTMAGASLWLAVATYYSLPVSTTHSLVGALIGVGVMAKGTDGIQWRSVLRIVSSWVSSPLLGGIISYLIFQGIYSGVLCARDPPEAARRVTPIYSAGTAGLLSVFLCLSGPQVLRIGSSAASGLGVVVACLVYVGLRLRGDGSRPSSVLPSSTARFEHRTGAPSHSLEDGSDQGEGVNTEGDDGNSKKRVSKARDARDAARRESFTDGGSVPDGSEDGRVGNSAAAGTADDSAKITRSSEAERSFTTLMVVTACVVSLAHGSNDVSNSIGPFSALYEIYQNGVIRPGAPPPLWVLVAGGLGIVVGLGTYGHKVMATVGEKIAKLTFSRGYAAQIGTALTVLTATQLGVSVSTTHCLIGAISGVALVEGRGKLNTATLRRIVVSWVVTIPAAAAFTVALYVVLPIGL